MYRKEGIFAGWTNTMLVFQWDTSRRAQDRVRCSLRLQPAHFPQLERLSSLKADTYMRLSEDDIGRLLVVDFYDDGTIIDYLTK